MAKSAGRRGRKRASRSASPSRSRLRSGAAATLLVATGAAVGVGLGTVWDAPRLLVRRLREPVQRVAVAPAESEPAPAPAQRLEQFRELQTARKASSRPARARAANAPKPPAAEPPAREPPAPRPALAPDPVSSPPPLIPPPSPLAGLRPGPVVQVASYLDERVADRLAGRLLQSGFDAYVGESIKDGLVRYRVRVHPTSGVSVEELARRLQDRGHAVWITRE